MLDRVLQQVKQQQGAGMLIFILVFGSLAITIIILGVAGYALFEYKVSVRKHREEQALHVAEAGINYYRWHLAHAPNDFADGTEDVGPYEHSYTDKDGNIVGYFSLEIIPPEVGTHLVTIKSTGWTAAYPDITRTVSVRIGYP